MFFLPLFSSPARDAWEKVPKGRMRADARNARRIRNDRHPKRCGPTAPDGAALIRRVRATFSRKREKDDSRAARF